MSDRDKTDKKSTVPKHGGDGRKRRRRRRGGSHSSASKSAADSSKPKSKAADSSSATRHPSAHPMHDSADATRSSHRSREEHHSKSADSTSAAGSSTSSSAVDGAKERQRQILEAKRKEVEFKKQREEMQEADTFLARRTEELPSVYWPFQAQTSFYSNMDANELLSVVHSLLLSDSSVDVLLHETGFRIRGRKFEGLHGVCDFQVEMFRVDASSETGAAPLTRDSNGQPLGRVLVEFQRRSGDGLIFQTFVATLMSQLHSIGVVSHAEVDYSGYEHDSHSGKSPLSGSPAKSQKKKGAAIGSGAHPELDSFDKVQRSRSDPIRYDSFLSGEPMRIPAGLRLQTSPRQSFSDSTCKPVALQKTADSSGVVAAAMSSAASKSGTSSSVGTKRSGTASVKAAALRSLDSDEEEEDDTTSKSGAVKRRRRRRRKKAKKKMDSDFGEVAVGSGVSAAKTSSISSDKLRMLPPIISMAAIATSDSSPLSSSMSTPPTDGIVGDVYADDAECKLMDDVTLVDFESLRRFSQQLFKGKGEQRIGAALYFARQTESSSAMVTLLLDNEPRLLEKLADVLLRSLEPQLLVCVSHLICNVLRAKPEQRAVAKSIHLRELCMKVARRWGAKDQVSCSVGRGSDKQFVRVTPSRNVVARMSECIELVNDLP